MQRPILVVLLICSLSLTGAAKRNNNKVPLAPLSPPILQAKTVFLAKGGGSELAYNSFYRAMKTWDRYKFVDSPDKADLIFELSNIVVDAGTPVFITTDSFPVQTQLHSPHHVYLQVRLTVYDSKTRGVLWSGLQHCDLASRKKNREKNTIQAAEMLARELRHRLDITSEMLARDSPHRLETPSN